MALGTNATYVEPVLTQGSVDPSVIRVQIFLASIRSVYLGESCLIEPGAAYLGVPFRFPTLAERAPTEDDPPADVRPLRGNALQEATGRLRATRKAVEA